MGEAQRRRKYRKLRVTRWSFAWWCPNCDHRDQQFLVDEIADEPVFARCGRCTYIMEVGPQHREAAHGREANQ